MRYELSDEEWATIRPMLPNKARGLPRVDDRRVLNGIFWVLRSGAPWRDLPNAFGPSRRHCPVFQQSTESSPTTDVRLKKHASDLDRRSR